jgi:hypothetical protein
MAVVSGGPLLPVAHAATSSGTHGWQRRNGIEIAGIDLWFFGGIAEAHPRQRVAGRGVPRQRGRAGGHAADRDRPLYRRHGGRRQ